MRFNHSDFSLEQAVGAIKLRVQEQGGHYMPLTPLKKAQLLKAEELYRWDKSEMSSSRGIETIRAKVGELFAEIERQCAEVNAQGNLAIECETNGGHACILRHEWVGLTVNWHQKYVNSLENSGLSVDKFTGRLIFQSELGRIMYWHQPAKIKSTTYEPELSREREYGWRMSGRSTGFVSSSGLAEKCVLQLMELIERAADGKLKNPNPY